MKTLYFKFSNLQIYLASVISCYGVFMVTYIDAKNSKRKVAGVIPIHDENSFAGMRKAGLLTAQALDMLTKEVRPGVSTIELDRLAFEFAHDNGAIPATLFYRGYRHSICTSINHVVCHGIPSKKPLREGDIVNIDITLIVDGWHGDSSRMYPVGEISRKAERLVEITYDSLQAGINKAKPGNTTGDIGEAIQTFVENKRASVVRDFVGHGLGLRFHDEPNIMHFGTAGKGVELKEGMIFTIEPMVNLGKPQVKILSDGWTAVTRDRTLSAQCEHSLGITKTGCEIFTNSPRGLFNPLGSSKKNK